MRQATFDQIQSLVKSLHLTTMMIREDTDTVVPTNDHIAIIKHYDHVRLAAAQIKEAREALKDMEDRLSREVVPDVMKLHNVKTITIEGVGRVTVSHRYSCSMLDKELGIMWLKDNGHGGIVQETVNSSTLAAFSKNLLEEEGKELPEDIFKVGTSPYTSITKAK